VFQQLKLDENGNVGCFIRYNGNSYYWFIHLVCLYIKFLELLQVLTKLYTCPKPLYWNKGLLQWKQLSLPILKPIQWTKNLIPCKSNGNTWFIHLILGFIRNSFCQRCWHNIQPKTILFDLLTWQAIKVKWCCQLLCCW